MKTVGSKELHFVLIVRCAHNAVDVMMIVFEESNEPQPEINVEGLC